MPLRLRSLRGDVGFDDLLHSFISRGELVLGKEYQVEATDVV